jgi:hypothetical protein
MRIAVRKRGRPQNKSLADKELRLSAPQLVQAARTWGALRRAHSCHCWHRGTPRALGDVRRRAGGAPQTLAAVAAARATRQIVSHARAHAPAVVSERGARRSAGRILSGGSELRVAIGPCRQKHPRPPRRASATRVQGCDSSRCACRCQQNVCASAINAPWRASDCAREESCIARVAVALCCRAPYVAQDARGAAAPAAWQPLVATLHRRRSVRQPAFAWLERVCGGLGAAAAHVGLVGGAGRPQASGSARVSRLELLVNFR